MGEPLILAIDQGTTGTKAILMAGDGRVVGEGYRTHQQFYPQPGWVEHDPLEIWREVQNAVRLALDSSGAQPPDVAAVALDNQGETVVAWDAASGKPLYNAVVWSCRRTQDLAEAWAAEPGWNEKVQEKTGLRIDPYFSATKARWILDHAPEAGDALKERTLRIGTVDSWLMWLMSGRARHVTDPSTASRTLLFNIHTGRWDPELVDYLRLPDWALAEVRPSTGELCVTDPKAFLGIEAPVLASVVDQPAALHGHLCLDAGAAKCTYGTGCFLLMNTGHQVVTSKHGLLTALAWDEGAGPTFALDGGVYSAGTAVNWLVSLGLVGKAADTGPLAESIDSTPVTFVPALTGLAAPHWDSDARGAFLGLTAAAGPADFVRAVLEGVAHRVADVSETMAEEVGHAIPNLRVDGGMTKNPFLMQFQADLLGVPVHVSSFPDMTALGVGLMAGKALGWWRDRASLEKAHPATRAYEPRMSADRRGELRQRWKKAIQSVKTFR